MAYAVLRHARPLRIGTLAAAVGWPVPAMAMQAAPASPGDGAKTEDAEPPKTPDSEAPDAGSTKAGTPGEPTPDPDAEDPATEPSGADPSSPSGADPTALSPEELAKQQLEAKINQATDHFKEGKRLYGNGRYGEAAVEFERSYASVPAANTLYAVSLAYGKAGKTVEAVRALENYLELPDCSQWAPAERPIDCTDQRADAERDLAQQRRRVGELTLDIPDGVELREVRVQGRTVPEDDFPLLMLPGTVDVELFGMGPKDRRSRTAYITAGEVYEVYVAPWKIDDVSDDSGTGGGGEPVDQSGAQRYKRLRITFWTGVGLTAASGVALGIMGGLTRYHQRRYEAEKCATNCHELDDDGDFILNEAGQPIPLDIGYPLDHERAFERNKPITNALVGVTIGLAVGTTLVGAFTLRSRNAERAAAKTARVRVRAGTPGLVVRW